MQYRTQNKKKRRNPQFIGRPLLVRDESSARSHFLEGHNVPPAYSCIFFAQEPFTILGISPQLSASDIANMAKTQSQKWKERLQTADTTYRDSLIRIIEQAEHILCEQCIPYRAFAKKYASLGRRYSKSHIRKAFFKALIHSAPGLRRRQTFKNFKVGGILDGAYPDSGGAQLGPLELSNRWRQYSIDLYGQNLSYIIGGFCLTLKAEDNPEGCIFYLDKDRKTLEK